MFYRHCDRCGINQIANFFHRTFTDRDYKIIDRVPLSTQRNATVCDADAARFIGVAHPGVNGRYYALEITPVSRARRRIAFVFAKASNREQSIRGSVKLWASSRRRFIHSEDLYFEKFLDNKQRALYHIAYNFGIYIYITFFCHMWDAWIEINSLYYINVLNSR